MNELINQYIGALLSVLMPDSFPKAWPICNETGQTVQLLRNNDLVVLLEYREPSRPVSPYYSQNEATVKVLTTQGNIGYMPARLIDYTPATRKQT